MKAQCTPNVNPIDTILTFRKMKETWELDFSITQQKQVKTNTKLGWRGTDHPIWQILSYFCWCSEIHVFNTIEPSMAVKTNSNISNMMQYVYFRQKPGTQFWYPNSWLVWLDVGSPSHMVSSLALTVLTHPHTRSRFQPHLAGQH
jgi:hypothetical protein